MWYTFNHFVVFYFRYLLFYHKKVLEYEWLRRSVESESNQIRLSPCSFINYPKNCTFWSILFSCQCFKWNKPPCRFGRRTHEGSTQITFLAKVVVQIYSILLSCQKSLKTFGLLSSRDNKTWILLSKGLFNLTNNFRHRKETLCKTRFINFEYTYYASFTAFQMII